ncbi:hypothetical protein [Streptomyces sp. NPDC090445]|uniref:hypothetical protein n=1 Tax=Streptomyces sp. NPDC090445 TaxID=3365963 RepID=UPI0037FBABE0
MTNAQILAACRTNWEYRGIDDASVRKMLDELSNHLEDAQAAGRTGADIVGGDVRAFAATWARARAPLPRRMLRTASLGCFVTGCVLLFSYVIRWTTSLDITPGYLALWAVLGTATVAWNLRRGTLGIRRSWTVALAAVTAALLTGHLAGDGVLFELPLWAALLLLLPGLPYAITDAQAKRNSRA